MMKDLIENITELNKNKIKFLKSLGKPSVGWTSIYTPEEIYYAAGIITFRITGETGIDTTDADAVLSHNFCSYVLSCLSEGLSGVYEFSDGIVFVDACDTRKRLYEAWCHNIKEKYSFFLELPKVINQVTREYFRLQVLRLVESVEVAFKCKITEQQLRCAIDLYNESRRLMQQIYELRKADSPCITGHQAMDIIKASTSGMREEFNKRLALLLAEANKVKNSEKERKHRVMLCGSYFDNNNIIETIERAGAVVVCEDVSNGIKYFEGEIVQSGNPLDAIADYYLDKATCARMTDSDVRLNNLLNKIEEYRVDSVIYFSLKFCDTNLIDFPYIKSKLQQNGIPVLFIEGELHMTSIENLKTRIMTFIETRMY